MEHFDIISNENTLVKKHGLISKTSKKSEDGS